MYITVGCGYYRKIVVDVAKVIRERPNRRRVVVERAAPGESIAGD
jgi:hypothetical protein